MRSMYCVFFLFLDLNLLKPQTEHKYYFFVSDHINELQIAYNFEAIHYMDQDPIKVCLHNALEPPPPKDATIPKSGVFIVFHGAPHTGKRCIPISNTVSVGDYQPLQ